MSENTPSHSLVIEGVFHATTHNQVLGGDDQTDSPSRHEKGIDFSRIVRHAVEQVLSSSEEEVERRIAATIDQIRGDLSRMQRVQQTMFAFVDTLAKALLAGLPEQLSPSLAREKERYERFLKSAAATTLAPAFASARVSDESDNSDGDPICRTTFSASPEPELTRL